MTLYDVAWSDSEKKWVARSSRLRWVGDTIAMRGVSAAHRIAQDLNDLNLGEHFTAEELIKATGVRAS